MVVLMSIVVVEYVLRQRRDTGGSQTANENQATSAQSVETSTTPASPAGMANERGPLTNNQNASSDNLNANRPRSESSPTLRNLSPVRVTDSGITITSDAPLNDYEAYRSGNRYYVVLPHANAAGLPDKLRGRGFDDVQVQGRGDGIVISFRLKPGASAHIDQKFNKLYIIVSFPGTTSSNTTSSANSQTRARRTAPSANER